MNVALVAFTCGRRVYLERTMQSFHEACDLRFTYRLMVDDSGDPEYGDWLRDTFRNWHVVSHDKRMGLGAAIDTAWSHLSSVDCDYVFHLEDDWLFPVPVPIDEMAAHLERDPSLAQVTLYRQPGSPQEHIAGGYLRLHDYELAEAGDATDLWVSRKLFSFNPSLYPKGVTHYRGGLEAAVTDAMVRDGLRFAVLAGDGETPLCFHIGAERSAGWQALSL
jgi:hypothetical protein